MYNTFGVKATASYFEDANSLKELIEILNNPIYQDLDKFILGGGSNTLFTKNFDGLVIKISIKGINIEKSDGGNIYLRAFAGEVWEDLVSYCIDNKYYGMENLSGIPGLVGATPIQNIGAYGLEIKEIIESVDVLDIDTKEIQTFQNQDCKFAYRDSIFKSELKDKYIVISVLYRLSKEQIVNLSYKALKDYFDLVKNINPTISDVRNAVLKIRSEKLPDISKYGTAGSFFKNPIISKSIFENLQKKYPQMPFYLMDEDLYKIPAGWLIETAGFKGKKFGNCGVYEKQALVLVNYGKATGIEILEFSKRIQNEIKLMFGIDLKREVVVI